MPACAACGQANPEIARFCLACGAPLAAGEGRREVRKTVTVVFCDVSGSTALADRLDPEAVRRVMERYFDEMQAVLERHGASVEKFIGDAVMAVFGVPVVHEDDALRAVRAAVEMRERLGELNREFAVDRNVTIAVRWGVNTGEVVAAEGGGQRLATGDAVNVAARLEQAAEPGEILIGADTYRLARHALVAEPVTPFAVKGKDAPLTAFRVRRVLDGAPSARRLDSALVGRWRELRRLSDAFEQAVADRSCHLFTLLGPAGVGKSRLVAEFVRDVDGAATVLRGRCLPYGEGITYRPVVEAIGGAVALEAVESPDEVRSAIAAAVAGEPDAELVAGPVAALVDPAAGRAGRDETFWAVRRLFESLARARPLLVVFDDVHWGEPSFLDLVEHLADWSRGAAILLLCVARPELFEARPGWGGGKLNATSLLLEPLGEEDSTRLIGNLLGEARLVGELQQRIVEAAEGNPLFVEEMLSMLIDDGVLQRRGDSWAVATDDAARVSVPPTIQALLSARLDQLGGAERAVLERAAVEGKVFHTEAVVDLAADDVRARVGEHLGALVRKELVRPEASAGGDGEVFRFRHQLIRDAAYDAMPKELRADLHERLADWVDQRRAGRLDVDEVVGFHLERAYRYRAELAPLDEAGRALGILAAERLAGAARTAMLGGDVVGGAAMHARAAALVEDDDPRKLDFLPDLAHALGARGQLAEMRRVVDEIEVRARRARHDRALAGAGLLRLLHAFRSGDHVEEDEARERIAHAIDVFTRVGEDVYLSRAFLASAWLEWGARRLEVARRAGEHARRAGASEEAMYASVYALGALIDAPTPVEDAIAECHAVLRASEARRVEVNAHTVLAHLHALAGDFGAARGHIGRRREIAAELALPPETGQEALALGWLELLAGDTAAATGNLRLAADELRDYPLRSVVAHAHARLARALCDDGRPDEAVAVPLAEYAAFWLDPRVRFEVDTTRALVLAHTGEGHAAEPMLREALERTRDGNVPVQEAYGRSDLAVALACAGRADEARRELGRAVELFERKGATAGAAYARRRLEGDAVRARPSLS